MNILYVSHLSNNISAGSNWSVPAGVGAQSKIDNVFWVDTNGAFQEHWGATGVFHTLEEFGNKLSLGILPAPFNCPDLVVFEGFYSFKDVQFSWELRRKKIPYIIIPRGSLTRQALHNGKRWKKVPAHLLFFDSYVRNALAVQFLTEAEFRDSGKKWNRNNIIIPNGFSTPKVFKQTFSEDGIKAIFIGRLDMYHKGLDLLLDVCKTMRDELLGARFSLVIYGPERYDYHLIEKTISDYGLQDIVSLGGEVGGQVKERAILDADLFILTSRFEGHPMGLIEALAYGLPCLITRGANMLEKVRDSNAGWTCEISAESIKDALRQMISDKNLFEGKSRNARTLAALYNWDSLAMQFHEQIKQILK